MDREYLNSFFEKLYKKNFWKNLGSFLIGALITAIAFNLFFEGYGVIPTGSGGLALILTKYIPFSSSILLLIIGLICLIVGLILYGFEYAIKMLLMTFLYPLLVSLTALFTRYIDLGDTSLFLIVVFGGGLVGFANGLIRNSGYNPGGFAVIFDIMHQYLHISIGVATVIVNLTLMLFCTFTFGLEAAIYSIISLIVSSYITDRVMFGISDNKVFYIITTKPLEIKDYIIDKLHYSVTLVNARGGFSNKKKKVLMSVISTREYVKVRELLKKIDPEVFFLIVDAYESNVRKNV